ncbi:MAG: fumarylacetoacetate hydrolase family protein [Actinomycetota bacterium]
MELVTVRNGGSTRAGRIDGDEIVLLAEPSVREVLAAPGGLDAAADADGERLAMADADLAPLIPEPAKIICVGANYRDHIEEMGRQPPSHPTYFAKFARSLVGAGDDLVLPPSEMSTDIDWEGELAVVIGRPARNVTRDVAIEHIAGFTIMNDVSVRDWQRRTTQFLAGKANEALTPLGPKLVTTDRVGDGSGLALTTTVNGEVKQHSSTDQLVFDALDVIADLSRILTLDPGDVIATGTPGGVGAARTPPEFLRPGDEVVVTIDGLGEQRNRCR